MGYITVDDFLRSKKTEKDMKEFIEFIRLIGIDRLCNETWDRFSMDLMRLTHPLKLGKVEVWTSRMDFGDAFIEMSSCKSDDGTDYNAYWYKINDDTYINGNAEYVSFPDGQREWFNKIFTLFTQKYYDRKR
jgi:hypothetical protein